MSTEAKPGPWGTKWKRAYTGKAFWIVCRHNPASKRPFGIEPLTTKLGEKRFYSLERAEQMAAKLNAAKEDLW